MFALSVNVADFLQPFSPHSGGGGGVGVGWRGVGVRLLPPVFLLSAPSSAKFGKLHFTFPPPPLLPDL